MTPFLKMHDFLDSLSAVTGGKWELDLHNLVYRHESGFSLTKWDLQSMTPSDLAEIFAAYIEEKPQIHPKVVKVAETDKLSAAAVVAGPLSPVPYKVTEHWSAGNSLAVVPRQLTKRMTKELKELMFSLTYNGQQWPPQQVWDAIVSSAPGGGLVPLDVLKKHASQEVQSQLHEQINMIDMIDMIDKLSSKLKVLTEKHAQASAATSSAMSDYSKLAEASMQSMGELTDQVEKMTHFAKASINLLDGLLARVQEHGSMPKLVSDYGPLVDALRSELGGVLKAQQNIE